MCPFIRITYFFLLKQSVHILLAVLELGKILTFVNDFNMSEVLYIRPSLSLLTYLLLSHFNYARVFCSKRFVLPKSLALLFNSSCLLSLYFLILTAQDVCDTVECNEKVMYLTLLSFYM